MFLIVKKCVSDCIDLRCILGSEESEELLPAMENEVDVMEARQTQPR